MLICVNVVQECDATTADSSTAAGIKIKNYVKTTLIEEISNFYQTSNFQYLADTTFSNLFRFYAMKKAAFILSLTIFLFACNNKKSDAPDVSNIKVDVKLERFDRDFFAIDTNNISAELDKLYNKYPSLTPIFLQNVLGLDSAATIPGVRSFISTTKKSDLFTTVNNVFKNTNALEQDFKNAFQYVKYYFPAYKLPGNIITIAGPVDAMAQSESGPTPNFLTPDFLGISLQFYLGKNFPLYSEPFFIENVAPEFRSRRFSKEYIIGDAMQLIVNDIFPSKNGGKPLVEQMVEKGKSWYLLDKFLPTTPDSVKTGYTQQQLNWCNENEGLIWGYIIKNEDLYSLTPSVIQTYIGEGPFTQGFSQELSPGNLGQWLGWQIIKKFVSKNPNMKPEEVMNTEAKKILDEAKYRPK